MCEAEPWQPGDPLKGIPASIFADDDGSADARLAQALIRLSHSKATLADVVDALAYARVLVPVVADGEHRIVGKHGLDIDHVASAGVVAIQAPDGRTALPIFTDVAAMAAWRADARPIPAEGPRAALAAAAEGWAVMVLNPGIESVIIPRPAVWALGSGEPWRPAVVDGTVIAEVEEAVALAIAAKGPVASVSAVPGRQAELAIVLGLVEGLSRDEVDAVIRDARDAVAASSVIADRVDSLEIRVVSA